MKDCTPSVLSTAIIAVYMSMKKLGPPTMGGGAVPSLYIGHISTTSCGAVYWALMQLHLILLQCVSPGLLDILLPMTLLQLLHLPIVVPVFGWGAFTVSWPHLQLWLFFVDIFWRSSPESTSA